MGRRKQKKILRRWKKQPKLDTEFNCPFCHHSRAIEIKLDRQKGISELQCRVCAVSFTAEISKLDEAVDVYSKWIDKCIEVNDGRIDSISDAENDQYDDENDIYEGNLTYDRSIRNPKGYDNIKNYYTESNRKRYQIYEEDDEADSQIYDEDNNNNNTNDILEYDKIDESGEEDKDEDIQSIRNVNENKNTIFSNRKRRLHKSRDDTFVSSEEETISKDLFAHDD